MFIRYNPVAKYYEYSTDITRRGKGPWLILPIDYTQIYNLPPIPPPYVLPATVVQTHLANVFTNVNTFNNASQFNGRINAVGGGGLPYNLAHIEVGNADSPRIAFHWHGVVASQIGVDTSGRIRTYDNPGTGYESFVAASIAANGILSATGYIMSTGVIYPGRIDIAGSQGGWYLASHGGYGLYTNTGLKIEAGVHPQYIGFLNAQVSQSAPNSLDDYEEGTWTPYFSSSNGGSATYAIQNGSYTKIGNVVTFTFDLQIASYGFVEGFAILNGFPFINSGYYGSGQVSYFTITNSVSWFGILIDPNAASASFRFTNAEGSSGTGMLYVGNIGAGRMIGGGTYRTPT